MRKFQIVSTIFYLIASVIVVAFAIRAADGHLIYTLDDPYIHLAVAENILHGGYGVNLNEFSSPSSSMVWPFLMALMLWLGFGNWGPLLVGMAATALSVWLISGYFWRQVVGAPVLSGKYWLFILIAPLLILCVNGLALPMTGMEHPLHVLGCVLIILGLTDLAQYHRVPLTLLVGIVLCPLVRFEGLALALAALAAIAYQRQFVVAFATAVILVAIMSVYVIGMTSIGLPPLPSSVLMKSGVSAAAMEGRVFAPLVLGMINVFSSLNGEWGRLFFAAGGLLLLAVARAEPLERKVRGLVIVPAMVALGAHLAFGRYGWFGRYEVYAVATMLLAMLFAYSSTLLATRSVTIRFLVLALLLIPMAHDYSTITMKTPMAARNIYEQQYQMHRFSTEFFPHPVAVNDLGWVAYRNDNFVLDLWGLGSEEMRRLALAGARTAAAMSRLTQEKNVAYAMLYDEWFQGNIPADWCRIAVLNTSSVVAASGEVAFYLLAPNRKREMTMALADFKSTLPAGAELTILGCRTE